MQTDLQNERELMTTSALNLLTTADLLSVAKNALASREWPKIEALSRLALEQDPLSAQANALLSESLREQGDPEGARVAAEAAIAGASSNARGFKCRALAYRDLGRWVEAERDLWQCVALDPDEAEYWVTLGYLLMIRGQWSPSRAAYQKAVALNPNDFHARFSVVTNQMALGDWSPETLLEYEIRTLIGGVPHPINGKPLWQGEDLAGRTVLLCGEQGLGDIVMFIRYARLLQDRGARVIVRVLNEWVPLAWRFYGVAQVIAVGDELPEYDYHVPMMSCWRHFGVYSGDGAYMDLLGPADFPRQMPIIGLCSQGNPKHQNDRYRSLPKAAMAELYAGVDVVPKWLDRGDDGIDTPIKLAKAINECDLIVTVDTAVAHIAGALLKPVWTLLPLNCDFRWAPAKGVDTTPWYPTMKLYRCAEPLAWGPVLERVKVDLETFREGWVA